MTSKKNPAAVALGRLGGRAKSPAKTKAAQANAKKGGWPKGRPRTTPTTIQPTEKPAMKTIKVPVTEIKYEGTSVVSDHVLVEPGGRRFGVGGIPRGHSGRKVYQGPLVPGPWAFAFGLSTVIAANRALGTGAEIERNRAAGIEHDVTEGDLVEFDNVRYTVRLTDGFGMKHGRCDFIRLEVVEDLAPDATAAAGSDICVTCGKGKRSGFYGCQCAANDECPQCSRIGQGPLCKAHAPAPLKGYGYTIGDQSVRAGSSPKPRAKKGKIARSAHLPAPVDLGIYGDSKSEQAAGARFEEELGALVSAVRGYARTHYTEGGWDAVVEAWDDSDIAAQVVGLSLDEAIATIGAMVKVQREYGDDIRAEADEPIAGPDFDTRDREGYDDEPHGYKPEAAVLYDGTPGSATIRPAARKLYTKAGKIRRGAHLPVRDRVAEITAGDRVTIVDDRGQERTGRAVMPSSHGGWVLNMGGRHGTPGIADASNIVRVAKGGRR